jgi:mRNA interferase MazF
VVIIQTDLLNEIHLSTIICPITTNIKTEAEILRIHLNKDQLPQLSDILVDQPRAIDNKRFIKRLGKLTPKQAVNLKNSLKIVLDL